MAAFSLVKLVRLPRAHMETSKCHVLSYETNHVWFSLANTSRVFSVMTLAVCFSVMTLAVCYSMMTLAVCFSVMTLAVCFSMHGRQTTSWPLKGRKDGKSSLASIQRYRWVGDGLWNVLLQTLLQPHEIVQHYLVHLYSIFRLFVKTIKKQSIPFSVAYLTVQ